MTFLQGLGGVLTGGLSTVIDSIVNGANGGNGNVFQDSTGNGSGIDGQGHWNWASGEGGIPSGSPADAMFGENGLFSNPEGAWDNFKNGSTNATNKVVADENLQYQRERNAIEDARYEEETAYNRAFAEEDRDYQRQFAQEEREYQRALQQEIFDREDTALERQASSLSKLGINPLSQNMNGLNAGQALSASTPGSALAPAISSRGGQALHNDFRMQDKGLLSVLSGMMSIADTMNGLETGSYNRDSLALQNDAQYLQNLKMAHELGIDYKGYMPDRAGAKNYRKSHLDFYDDFDNNLFNMGSWQLSSKSYLKQKAWENANNDFKRNNNIFDGQPNWLRSLNFLSSDDVYASAESALTKGQKLLDNVFEKLGNETIYDLGKTDKNTWNPFKLFKSLFF